MHDEFLGGGAGGGVSALPFDLCTRLLTGVLILGGDCCFCTFGGGGGGAAGRLSGGGITGFAEIS